METISALKQGNMDHSQKTCYHCSRKGHIKANCPDRKKLGARPFHSDMDDTLPYIPTEIDRNRRCEKRTRIDEGIHNQDKQHKHIYDTTRDPREAGRRRTEGSKPKGTTEHQPPRTFGNSRSTVILVCWSYCRISLFCLSGTEHTCT